MKYVLIIGLLCTPLTSLHAADVKAFLETHCVACHNAESKEGNLDLTVLKPDFDDPSVFARWVTIHDRVRDGEMPPPKHDEQPSAAARGALVKLRAFAIRLFPRRPGGSGSLDACRCAG